MKKQIEFSDLHNLSQSSLSSEAFLMATITTNQVVIAESQSSLSSEAFLITLIGYIGCGCVVSQSSLSSEAFLIGRKDRQIVRENDGLNPLLVARHF